MAEAEDVLTDAARHATVFAQKLWRKYHVPAPSPRPLCLADVAQRLDLLIHSAFGQSHPLRVAQPPPHPTFLARIFGRIQTPFLQDAIPCTDGVSIWLPGTIASTDELATQEVFRLFALRLATRIERGSVEFFAQTANPLCADIYLLLEAFSADRDLRTKLPGIRHSLSNFYQQSLRLRPPLKSFSPVRRPLEQFYLSLLRGEDSRYMSTPAESFTRAHQMLAEFTPYTARNWSLQPLLKDGWSGDFRTPPSTQEEKGGFTSDKADSDEDKTARSGRLMRRPEVRKAKEDEDRPDNNAAWMVQGDESHPHAEDPLGLQRPADRDENTHPDEYGDLVSELAEARLVHTPGQAKEVLLSDDPPDAQATADPMIAQAEKPFLEYPEWDYRSQSYPSSARLFIVSAATGPQIWVDNTMEQHHALLQTIRRHFAMLRAQRVLLRKQIDGDEIDLDAFIHSRADFRSGNSFNDALYQSRRNKDRSLAITLLIDISGSTDGWISTNRRVIDVEREALLLVCVALETLGEPYSVLAFSGDGKHAVKMLQIKSFDEHFSNQIALRISALEPDRYTRTGAAIRHATTQLMRRSEIHKLLLLLSDGKPNDQDVYEGRYGLEDTRQAVTEAKLQGIQPFCLTIDRLAPGYLPAIFGAHQYALLPKPELLPRVLLEWMKRLVSA
jgi:nitric oxide reductase NorD protein